MAGLCDIRNRISITFRFSRPLSLGCLADHLRRVARRVQRRQKCGNLNLAMDRCLATGKIDCDVAGAEESRQRGLDRGFAVSSGHVGNR
jgi:hypothetical protein